jgi:hypothetical protein
MRIKYDKQDQQGKEAFNERNPYMTQQQTTLIPKDLVTRTFDLVTPKSIGITY